MLLDYLALGLLWSHVSVSLVTSCLRFGEGLPPNEWGLSGDGVGKMRLG